MCPVTTKCASSTSQGCLTHTISNLSESVITLFAEIKIVFVTARHEFSQLRSLQHQFTISNVLNFICVMIFLVH